MTCHFDSDITLALIANCGGAASTFLALLCLLMSRSVEQSLRAILISYSTSNMIGSGMFVFGIVAYVCNHEEHPLDYIVMMTIVMSLSHLLLLILHYYITLTTSKKVNHPVTSTPCPTDPLEKDFQRGFLEVISILMKLSRDSISDHRGASVSFIYSEGGKNYYRAVMVGSVGQGPLVRG